MCLPELLLWNQRSSVAAGSRSSRFSPGTVLAEALPALTLLGGCAPSHVTARYKQTRLPLVGFGGFGAVRTTSASGLGAARQNISDLAFYSQEERLHGEPGCSPASPSLTVEPYFCPVGRKNAIKSLKVL